MYLPRLAIIKLVIETLYVVYFMFIFYSNSEVYGFCFSSNSEDCIQQMVLRTNNFAIL